MTAGIPRHRTLVTLAVLGLVVGSMAAATMAAVEAAETPRRGGVLLAAIGADAPGLDPHQEQRATPAGRRSITNQKLQDVWLAED